MNTEIEKLFELTLSSLLTILFHCCSSAKDRRFETIDFLVLKELFQYCHNEEGKEDTEMKRLALAYEI